MRVLGAVLAGGQSRRFGTDKALARFGGTRLIDRAVATLARQCDAVVIAGRNSAGYDCVPDRPCAGLGPLGGLAGALHFGAQHDYDVILSCGVDSVGLPDDLIALLLPAPAYLASQPVIGLWPADRAAALDSFLGTTAMHAVRAFAGTIGARAVTIETAPANINTPHDLAVLEQHHGL